MAIRVACRWKPDTYRSSLETTVAGLDPAAMPPAGTIVMHAQLCAYDDTVVTGASYKAGDPVTERAIVVLYEESISMDLAGFDSLTQAQATQQWADALAVFRDRVSPAAPALLRAIRAARIASPVVLS